MLQVTVARACGREGWSLAVPREPNARASSFQGIPRGTHARARCSTACLSPRVRYALSPGFEWTGTARSVRVCFRASASRLFISMTGAPTKRALSLARDIRVAVALVHRTHYDEANE